MRLFSDDSACVIDPYLRYAFALAEQGRGTVAPNPLVGCAIVLEGAIVGGGWHRRAGEPHAEVLALRSAGDAARGATAYVTLEPCSHHGRTPPCTEALIEAGVVRVVIGMPDPSPAAGGGAGVLEAAGVDVVFAEDPAPFESLNEGWLMVLRAGRPWVTAKVAVSLDGRVSAAPGVRSRISGDESGAITMRLRATSDAVLVGAGTALVDDPALTVREADGAPAPHQPLRVILAGERDVSGASCVGDGLGPTAILTPEDGACPAAGPGCDVVTYPRSTGINGALEALAARGVNRVLAEPGPRLFTSLWDAGAIDELVLVHAGAVAGGDAPALYGGPGCGPVPELHSSMKAVEAGVSGDDAVTVWRPR